MSKINDFKELLETSTKVSLVLRRIFYFPDEGGYEDSQENLILRLGQSSFYLSVLEDSVHIFENSDHEVVLNYEQYTEDSNQIYLVPADYYLEESGEKIPIDIRVFIYLNLDLFMHDRNY